MKWGILSRRGIWSGHEEEGISGKPDLRLSGALGAWEG